MDVKPGHVWGMVLKWYRPGPKESVAWWFAVLYEFFRCGLDIAAHVVICPTLFRRGVSIASCRAGRVCMVS